MYRKAVQLVYVLNCKLKVINIILSYLILSYLTHPEDHSKEGKYLVRIKWYESLGMDEQVEKLVQKVSSLISG
jgi:DNA phosphorothioation-dependent restriction protein DptG